MKSPRFIKESKKSTPVKVYVNGDLSDASSRIILNIMVLIIFTYYMENQNIIY